MNSRLSRNIALCNRSKLSRYCSSSSRQYQSVGL